MYGSLHEYADSVVESHPQVADDGPCRPKYKPVECASCNAPTCVSKPGVHGHTYDIATATWTFVLCTSSSPGHQHDSVARTCRLLWRHKGRVSTACCLHPYVQIDSFALRRIREVVFQPCPCPCITVHVLASYLCVHLVSC